MNTDECPKEFPIGDIVRSMSRTLDMVPRNCHVALLLRHSVRKPIPRGTFGNNANLTPEGVEAAFELGKLLGQMQTGRLVSSPLPRCVQTARALVCGSGWNSVPVIDKRLGDPGVFVINPSLAGPLFSELGTEGVVSRQLAGITVCPGMRATSEGVQLLLDLMLGGSHHNEHIDVFVTHDAILAVLIGYLLGDIKVETQWPGYLEGLFIWRVRNGLGIAWRDATYRVLVKSEEYI